MTNTKTEAAGTGGLEFGLATADQQTLDDGPGNSTLQNPKPPCSIVERVARAIAQEAHGVDPDDNAPLGMICGPNNEPIPWWTYYEEDARAAIEAMREPTEAMIEVLRDIGTWAADHQLSEWDHQPVPVPLILVRRAAALTNTSERENG